MKEFEFLNVERLDRVALVRLNRPEVLNAISPAVLSELSHALGELDSDSDLRGIVLTGNRRAFAAGADLKTMVNWTPEIIAEVNTQRYWSVIQEISLPMIAAVSGYAYGGGCELAMLCDMIIASETALFAQPEIKVGIMPGAGGTQRLQKAIGPYKAMEMILTGEPISAREAHAAGLVNRVVPEERYLEEALELAALIASRPPLAVKMAKKAFRKGLTATMREGLELERRNYIQLYDTQDQEEGMRAFLEKRDPEFKGT